MERSEILALRVEELRRKLSELQLGTTGFKVELQETLLTYYGLNYEGESETEDNAEEGLSVTSAETTINRPNAAGWHPGLGNERLGRSWFMLKDVEGSVS